MKTIRQLRDDRGLTQFQLAVALGVTPATISNWETGRFEPKASQLRTVARYFGVSMDEVDFAGGHPPDTDRAGGEGE